MDYFQKNKFKKENLRRPDSGRLANVKVNKIMTNNLLVIRFIICYENSYYHKLAIHLKSIVRVL